MQLRHLAKREERDSRVQTGDGAEKSRRVFLARLSADDLEATAGEARSAKLAVDFYLFISLFPQDLKIGFALL